MFDEQESGESFRKVRKPKDWYDASDPSTYYGNDGIDSLEKVNGFTF